MTPFDGETYVPALDRERLKSQLERVKALMSDGRWRTYAQIREVCGGTENSVSARCRDFRKPKFGGHTLLRRRVEDVPGLHEYRLILAEPGGQLTLGIETEARR